MKRTSSLATVLVGLADSALAQVADFTPPTPLVGAVMHNKTQNAIWLLNAGAYPIKTSKSVSPPRQP